VPRLSAIIITRNEAANIADCLQSLAFCDERIVVDAGSSDGTLLIARENGARVATHSWRGFGPQKNYALSLAHGDWVLSVDADERVTPELAAAIAPEMAAPRAAAYAFARRNRFLGRWLAHGEGYPDWNVRLFDRRRARWSEDPVHEHVLCDGPVARLAGDLLHASAESLDDYLAKQNRYTSLQAAAMHARGERAGMVRLVLSPLARFVRFYVLKLGFLDGVAGLVHIAIGCQNSFLKYAKLRALDAESRR
jgi:glycosyltransferase involved in cell wall biosynthesis